MARTTLDLDEKLIESALDLAEVHTKKAVIEEALKEYINIRRRQKILSLIGSGIMDMTQVELEEMRGKPRT
ncbi:MAG TPA: type II toxin-antitoxin system VapB family antitoxin [Dehalococcoidia bacterium]|nr:type II toxin-antitoxin system VapB family antitoxin [Dehalococcoidia bacterium]